MSQVSSYATILLELSFDVPAAGGRPGENGGRHRPTETETRLAPHRGHGISVAGAN